MQVTVKFDIKETGRGDSRQYHASIEGVDVYASTKTLLAEKLKRVLIDACRKPQIAVVRGNDQFRVMLGYMDRVETYKPVESDQHGRVLMTCTSYGSGDVVEEADKVAMHLAQQEWEPGQPMPSYVPKHMVREFEAWVRFQDAYRLALASGCSYPVSHELACQAM